MSPLGKALGWVLAVGWLSSAAWAEPGGSQTRSQPIGPSFDRMLLRFDANGDGRISKDEFHGREPFFRRMDADGDGAIDQQEFDARRLSARLEDKQAKRAPSTGRSQRYEAFVHQAPASGDRAPAFDLRDLQGNLVSLEQLLKTRPVVIETGSYTCPVFRGRHESIERLHHEFGEKFHLVVLYGKEAHPGSKRFPDITQPTRNEQRVALAEGVAGELGIGVPVVVDDVDNRVTSAYGGLPNCGYLIGQDGRVFHKLSWIHPDLMREPLRALLKMGGSGGADPPVFPVGGNLPNESRKPQTIERPSSDTSDSEVRRPGQQRVRPRAPRGVTTHNDLTSARVEGKSLRLDLYFPSDTVGKPPLVMWIHGGGWKRGNKSQVNGAILRLAEYGYAAASIDYRLGDLRAHPDHIHDCKGALRWLKAHADRYGYDPQRVAVGGGSAGGHLALLLGMSAGVDDLEGEVGRQPRSVDARPGDCRPLRCQRTGRVGQFGLRVRQEALV